MRPRSPAPAGAVFALGLTLALAAGCGGPLISNFNNSFDGEKGQRYAPAAGFAPADLGRVLAAIGQPSEVIQDQDAAGRDALEQHLQGADLGLGVASVGVDIRYLYQLTEAVKGDDSRVNHLLFMAGVFF